MSSVSPHMHSQDDGKDEVAYIVQPVFKDAKSAGARRDVSDIVEEAEGLVRAIALGVCKTRIVQMSKINAGTYFGKGTREDIAAEVGEAEPAIIVVNATLSPVQQRNLEKEWNAKVIDRTGLILEIFGERAQTKEGRLQVDLAALEYQKSRLVRSWTHLERQRGGAGFMGGPGERQIELDRRIISQRITKLKKELEDVRRTRELGRKSRERVPYPIVSFVGYTNAGKSTLFNRITDAGVFAEDLPFATLDPTLRKITLPNNQEAILTDTVGFIADLPTHLVEAFRATLEQITFADVIVHITDVSREDYQIQRNDVIGILKDLGISYETDERIVEVYNKIDTLDSESISDIVRYSARSAHKAVCISALSGQGVDDLLARIADVTAAQYRSVLYVLPGADGKALAWLHAHGDVLEQNHGEDGKMELRVRMDETNINKFASRFSYHPLIGS